MSKQDKERWKELLSENFNLSNENDIVTYDEFVSFIGEYAHIIFGFGVQIGLIYYNNRPQIQIIIENGFINIDNELKGISRTLVYANLLTELRDEISDVNKAKGILNINQIMKIIEKSKEKVTNAIEALAKIHSKLEQYEEHQEKIDRLENEIKHIEKQRLKLQGQNIDLIKKITKSN